MRESIFRVLAAVSLTAATGCARLSGLADLTVDECMNDACDPGAPGADAAGGGPADATAGGGGGGDGGGVGANDAAPPSGDGALPVVDAAADARTDTGAGGTDASADVGVDAPVVTCSGTAGPTQVQVGSFCIDSTEVTNKNYADFLSAKGQDLGVLPAACSFKATLTPSGGWPANSTKANDPVVYVDWCDAYAYCAYAGKRLCGAIGGGASALASLADKNVDEWYAACSAGGTVYPYGTKYVAGKCNDLEGKSNGTRAVASYSGCVGGAPGIFDMAGNAFEWEDACAASVGSTDSCIIRGGSWAFSGATYAACGAYFNDYTVKRSDAFNDTGFRCCSK